MHILQIRQRHPKAQQAPLARRCTFDPSLSRSTHHRPRSFPVQWLPLRRSHPLHLVREEPIDTSPERDLVRCPPLPKAHILILGPGILCLSPQRILSRTKVDLPDPVCQLRKAGCFACIGLWDCLWPFHLLTADPTAFITAISILQRPVSCLLGAKCMGTLLFCGQSSDSTYVQS